MFRIIQTSRYWVTLSVVTAIAGIVVYFVWGLNLGIDFTGGTSMQLHFPTAAARPASSQITTDLAAIGIVDPVIQPAGTEDVILKMHYIENDKRQQIIDIYAEKGVVEQSFSSIGPTLGAELKHKAFVALALVLLAIIGFISYAFRNVSRGPVPSWVFGLGAIVALVHDIFIVIGVFVVLGKFAHVQIDSLFVTALLTILGFSVHDTIVVYDRIRERLKDRDKKTFAEIINESINSTLVRSLNTSLTTLIVLFALYFFGGASIQHFVLALIVGIISGTYSSIFIASPFLLLGQKLLKR